MIPGKAGQCILASPKILKKLTLRLVLGHAKLFAKFAKVLDASAWLNVPIQSVGRIYPLS